ncbi:MAG: hypothetical protein HQ503_07795 [Rhodospirillales bacterium]|nr:hypothetical protein [Rhodospirillales bacterium]
MTTFLIIAAGFYIYLATLVAETARGNGRGPLKWLLAALAINPLVAQFLLFSRLAEAANR